MGFRKFFEELTRKDLMREERILFAALKYALYTGCWGIDVDVVEKICECVPQISDDTLGKMLAAIEPQCKKGVPLLDFGEDYRSYWDTVATILRKEQANRRRNVTETCSENLNEKQVKQEKDRKDDVNCLRVTN